MKTLLFILLSLCISGTVLAGHIAGGEMYYKYIGPGSTANTNSYQITLRLFRQCNPPTDNGQRLAELPTQVEIAVFDAVTGQMLDATLVASTTPSPAILSLLQPLPCITSYDPVCYQVATYSFQKDLPVNAGGYTASFQTCCRSNSLVNIRRFAIGNGSSGEGATYACDIPGTDVIGVKPNSSAVFALKDTVLVCQYKNIRLDFSATDPDNDSLSYSLCSAYDRGTATGADNHIPSNPPYNSVTYQPGFSGSTPLGPNITIDPVTGIIQGKAPVNGGYVVNVCVTEWRQGKAISVHRKDFMVSVQNCDFAAAELPSTYINCSDFSFGFANESASSQIHSYYWDFGVAGSTTDTSSKPTPTFTYTDTGSYTIKLVVNRGEQCSDSATTQVKVYPGFNPDFKATGSCLINPYHFTDETTSKYGLVNGWSWNFGETTTLADTSHLQNPNYKYSVADSVNVQLIVTNTKGCIDTVSHVVQVSEKLLIDLPFRDTLICSIDTLQLKASGEGTFTWSPVSTMLYSNTPDPYVFPKDTTTYYVTESNNGCVNTDSVRVNVLDSITVKLPADTTICRTDSLQLHPVSDGLQYLWSPATAMNDPTLKQPTATPLSNILYQVVAHLGKCVAQGSTLVKVVPYPQAKALPDASICFGATISLNGTIDGSSFKWSPVNSLEQSNTLTPIAGPTQTTAYVLYSYDTLGCPKPGTDTAFITVIPPVQAWAGNDTAVVINQPLQFNASGGVFYTWTPATDLSNPSIANPIGVYDGSLDSIIYKVRVSTIEGCYSDAQVKVKIFRPYPEIYVPSGFTPNNDGKNDVLRPIPVGVQKLLFFRVYNRWGQLLFSTSEINKGWDGTFEGQPQPAATYVYTVQGIDYKNSVITRKGTSVLIR